jgi:hypothetical protein
MAARSQEPGASAPPDAERLISAPRPTVSLAATERRFGGLRKSSGGSNHPEDSLQRARTANRPEGRRVPSGLRRPEQLLGVRARYRRSIWSHPKVDRPQIRDYRSWECSGYAIDRKSVDRESHWMPVGMTRQWRNPCIGHFFLCL